MLDPNEPPAAVRKMFVFVVVYPFHASVNVQDSLSTIISFVPESGALFPNYFVLACLQRRLFWVL